MSHPSLRGVSVPSFVAIIHHPYILILFILLATITLHIDHS
jgi:hypothetical protein